MPFENNMAVLALHRPRLAAALAAAQPAGEILSARSGLPTLRAEGPEGQMVYLHSAYDPRAEAARLTAGFQLLRGDTFLVMGIGLGYHVWDLLERCPGLNLVAIDPHPGFFLRAMQVMDLSAHLSRPNLTLIFGHDVQETGQIVFDLVDLSTRKEIKTYSYPPLARLYPQEFADLERAVLEGLTQSVFKHNTSLHFAARWTENLLANLEAAWLSQGIDSLSGQFDGVPAVIISAGPSLDKNMHLLSEIKGRAVTIAAGTSFKSLRAAGLLPDLVASIDGGEPNGQNFRGVREDEAALVFDPVVYPSIPPCFQGPRFAGSGYPFFAYFLDYVLGLNKGLFRISGFSIAHTCLGLALEMGCDPIIFIGQDLAFSGDRSHVSGSIYDNVDLKAVSGALLEVEGNDGGKVPTSSVFLAFLRNLEEEIAKVGDHRLFINATEGGARIRGTRTMTFREAIDRYMPADHDTHGRIRRLFQEYDPQAHWMKMMEGLRRIDRDLLKLAKATDKGAGLAAELLAVYEKGVPEKKVLDKLRRGLDAADRRVLEGWQANLLLQRAFYPVHVRTFSDSPDRHPDLAEQEKGRLVARQSQILYQGLKETIVSTEEKLREAILGLEQRQERFLPP